MCFNLAVATCLHWADLFLCGCITDLCLRIFMFVFFGGGRGGGCLSLVRVPFNLLFLSQKYVRTTVFLGVERFI